MKAALIVTLFLILAPTAQGFAGEIVEAIVGFFCSLPLLSFLCSALRDDAGCNENTALERMCSPASDCIISPETIRSKAEALALLHSTEPTAPPGLVEQFVTSLEIIAKDHAYLKPRMESPYAVFPWEPNEIFVSFTDEAKQELDAGTYNSTELDQLNEDWGVVEIELLYGATYIYRFDKLYNLERLASIYETIPGIKYAETNGLIGAGPRDLVNNEGTRFTFSVGWGDCPSGCISVFSWSFCVDNDEGTIIQMDNGCERPELIADEVCPNNRRLN